MSRYFLRVLCGSIFHVRGSIAQLPLISSSQNTLTSAVSLRRAFAPWRLGVSPRLYEIPIRVILSAAKNLTGLFAVLGVTSWITSVRAVSDCFRRAPLYSPALLCVLLLLTSGCLSSTGDQVVVYTALDAEFSRPILDDFERQSGVTVRAKYDTEANKTIGLVEAIIAEGARPRCDVFWNNEILNSLRLQKRGLLEVYHSPIADSYPAPYRSPDGYWSGFAARARVLLVNTKRLADTPRDQWPDSIHDLVDPRWKDRSGVARPLFGTTATHAACLFAHWGDDQAKDFFLRLKANAQILSGNKQVALATSSGQIVFGLTDTDDAIIELEKGMPVQIVYPDSRPDQLGTLFIPNTLALVKNGPNPEAGRRLIDYLLSPEVETRLAQGPSAQIPLNSRIEIASRTKGARDRRVETPATIHAMPVDFAKAAAAWPTAARFLRDEFAKAD